MPKKGKWSSKAAPRKVAIKRSITSRIAARSKKNPFNRITVKKFRNHVLGQKVRGNTKRPGHAIDRAIEKRKQSLLKEYAAIEKNQFNTFIDKRFEKGLNDKVAKLKGKKGIKSQRFQLMKNRDKKAIQNRIKMLKTQRFDLKHGKYSLDDADNFKVTHLGAPIDDETFAKSNRSVSVDYDDDFAESSKYLYRGFSRDNIYKMVKEKKMTLEEVLEKAGVSNNKFENKSKPNLIKEQILRSRYKKCQAQIYVEETMGAISKVDRDFKANAKWILAHRANPNRKVDGKVPPQPLHPQDPRRRALEQKRNELDMEYEARMEELANDERAHVTDRTKTDLQRAKHNLEVLTSLEKKRQRREAGLPSESEEEDAYDLRESSKNGEDDSTNYIGEITKEEARAERDDANMMKLEEMFDRAQRGYDEVDEMMETNGRENGKADTVGFDSEHFKWQKLLEEVDKEQNDPGAYGPAPSTIGGGDDDDDFGYEADIDKQFMPRKRGVQGLNDGDCEFGAEPAGKGNENIIIEMEKKEKEDKVTRKEQREKEKGEAIDDFESVFANKANDIRQQSYGPKRTSKEVLNSIIDDDGDGDDDDERKKGIKRKRRNEDAMNMEAEVDWSTLDLQTELTIDSSAMARELGDIPFTLQVPPDMDAFEELMNGKTAEQQIVLLKRMRSANHVRLDPMNRGHIQRLYDMLLDYFRKLCVEYKPTTTPNCTKVGALSHDIEFYKNIDVVTRGLFALSHDIPKYAKLTHLGRLGTIGNFIHNRSNLKRNTHFKMVDHRQRHCNMDPIASFMPSGYALFYFKLLAHIFPTKNKMHTLMTSLILILSRCLSDITINGPRDVACALFCITLLIDILRKEQRYAPEVIHSLTNILRAGFLSPDSFDKSTFDLLTETDDLYFTFRAGSTLWHNLKNGDCSDSVTQHRSNQMTMPMPLRYLFLKDNGHEVFQRKEFRIQTLFSALKLIFEAHKIWKSMLAYSELFGPFYDLLREKEIRDAINSSHPALAELRSDIQQCLKMTIEAQGMSRKPLQIIHKAVPLQMLEPDFSMDLKPSFLKMRVANEAALAKKQARMLKKAQRKQEKAIMKEFRKDTEFIMREKTKGRVDADNKRHAKWQHEYHQLTEQQHDTNSFQMVGRKLKKKLVKEGVIQRGM